MENKINLDLDFDYDEIIREANAWEERHISKETIDTICHLFMEHECIEKCDGKAIDWIYEKLNE